MIKFGGKSEGAGWGLAKKEKEEKTDSMVRSGLWKPVGGDEGMAIRQQKKRCLRC